MIAPLSHCPDCDLWLRPDEGCLHMPAMPLKGRFDASEGNANRRHTARSVFQPFHASEIGL